MRAARVGPGITQFALRLPKTLARGKARPVVFADGGRMRPHTGRRLATMPFPREVRSATLVWRGLKTSRRLKKTAVVRLRMTDGRPHVTSVKQKVRVRGKAPAQALVDILDLLVGGSSNGKTPASGAGYRGSSPCPPVTFDRRLPAQPLKASRAAFAPFAAVSQ